MVRTLCTNRDLPLKLQKAGDDLAFDWDFAGPIAGVLSWGVDDDAATAVASRRPLEIDLALVAEPPVADRPGGGPGGTVQEALRLYDFSDPQSGRQLAAVNEQMIEGVLSVSSRPVVRRTGAATSSGFARGLEVTVEFDEQKYVGGRAVPFRLRAGAVPGTVCVGQLVQAGCRP